MEPILALRGIRKAFSGQAILKGIDLSVEQGGFVTLLGPSGCGKTTLLRIISGLLRPEEGKVYFCEMEPDTGELLEIWLAVLGPEGICPSGPAGG